MQRQPYARRAPIVKHRARPNVPVVVQKGEATAAAVQVQEPILVEPDDPRDARERTTPPPNWRERS